MDDPNASSHCSRFSCNSSSLILRSPPSPRFGKLYNIPNTDPKTSERRAVAAAAALSEACESKGCR